MVWFFFPSYATPLFAARRHRSEVVRVSFVATPPRQTDQVNFGGASKGDVLLVVIQMMICRARVCALVGQSCRVSVPILHHAGHAGVQFLSKPCFALGALEEELICVHESAIYIP